MIISKLARLDWDSIAIRIGEQLRVAFSEIENGVVFASCISTKW